MRAAASFAAVTRPGPRPDGISVRAWRAAPPAAPALSHEDDRRLGARPAAAALCTDEARLGVRVVAATPSAARDPYARLARGCRPRGCRAPARRVHGRRVRYVIGDEPGQVNGMRWRPRVRARLGSP